MIERKTRNDPDLRRGKYFVYMNKTFSSMDYKAGPTLSLLGSMLTEKFADTKDQFDPRSKTTEQQNWILELTG
ncbi:unnamed protein product [Acanthoscelides obtectus]|uniref:Uncharacterized protein n=1 Tax=Acanthoscelides obtectus TaxID=200917 RepID=A0A9P0K5Y1_ACAOB|nr:unnamed protein product [Acanthoscelides obtectus]CAK1646718.1 hypothetical protein AOBTE_LOCUS14837 [Acanthoscelides obtectus]